MKAKAKTTKNRSCSCQELLIKILENTQNATHMLVYIPPTRMPIDLVVLRSYLELFPTAFILIFWLFGWPFIFTQPDIVMCKLSYKWEHTDNASRTNNSPKNQVTELSWLDIKLCHLVFLVWKRKMIEIIWGLSVLCVCMALSSNATK